MLYDIIYFKIFSNLLCVTWCCDCDHEMCDNLCDRCHVSIILCDITPLLLSKFKIKKEKRKLQIKERNKIKSKGKWNRVQPIVHNSDNIPHIYRSFYFLQLKPYFLTNFELITSFIVLLSNNASTITPSWVSILSKPIFTVTSLSMSSLSRSQ